MPAPLREVARHLIASGDDLRLFQDFFAHLGRACLLEVEDSQKRAEIRRLEERVVELERDRTKLLNRCAILEGEAQGLNQEVGRLEIRKERAQPKGMLAPLRIMKRAVVGPRSE